MSKLLCRKTWWLHIPPTPTPTPLQKKGEKKGWLVLTICKHPGLKGISFPLPLVSYAHTLRLLNHKIVVTEAPVNSSRNYNGLATSANIFNISKKPSAQYSCKYIHKKKLKKKKKNPKSKSKIIVYSSSPTSSTFIFVTYFLKNQSLKRAQISYYVANQRPLNATM